MMQRLRDQVAIITGGGRGIGRALALAFAREGAHLALTARTAAEVDAVCAEVHALDRQALAFAADIRNEDAVQELVQKTWSTFGRIDVLVNNAGVSGTPQPIFGTPLERWEDVISTNLRGTFLCTKHVWRTMIKQRRGVILNIGSISGPAGAALLSAYSTSKSGMIGFTKSIAIEGKQFNIRANVLCPGPTDTAMLAGMEQRAPNIRLMPAEGVASTALYLVSDDSRYATGQVLFLEECWSLETHGFWGAAE